MSFARIRTAVESIIANNRVGLNVETLTGTKTLNVGSPRGQKLDPGGAGRDVDLPAEESSAGEWFEITNGADAAEALTVKNDAGSTIVSLAQNEKTTVRCDGSDWDHMGIITIALS
jgi:hypothetical protein